MTPREAFIVVYRPKDALQAQTEFHGPFTEYLDAEDHLCTLPAAIDCDCKYIDCLIPPPVKS